MSNSDSVEGLELVAGVGGSESIPGRALSKTGDLEAQLEVSSLRSGLPPGLNPVKVTRPGGGDGVPSELAS